MSALPGSPSLLLPRADYLHLNQPAPVTVWPGCVNILDTTRTMVAPSQVISP